MPNRTAGPLLSYPIAAPTPPNLVRTDRPPVEVVEIWFADT